MKKCLYECGSDAPSTQEYHVYPASGSNWEITLEKGVVCDRCNAYFAELENYFVHYHPGASSKLLSLWKTKKGKQPKYESQAGVATRALNDDSSFELTVPMSDVSYETKEDGSIIFKCVAKGREFDATKISRVLGKISIEAVYGEAPSHGLNFDPYSPEYDGIRRYVRFLHGLPRFIWFAYKFVDGDEGEPRMGLIQGEDDSIVGVVSLIRLPGIHYLFPLLPHLDAHVLSPSKPDWTFITTPGMHPSKDFEAILPLHPVKSENDAECTGLEDAQN